jgi:hypothetical protein
MHGPRLYCPRNLRKTKTTLQMPLKPWRHPCNPEPNNIGPARLPSGALALHAEYVVLFGNKVPKRHHVFECLGVRRRRGSKTRPIFRKAICIVLELVEGCCGWLSFGTPFLVLPFGAKFPLLTSQPLGLVDRTLALSGKLTRPHFDGGFPPAVANSVSTIASITPQSAKLPSAYDSKMMPSRLPPFFSASISPSLSLMVP